MEDRMFQLGKALTVIRQLEERIEKLEEQRVQSQ
jgi:hypothetical protein